LRDAPFPGAPSLHWPTGMAAGAGAPLPEGHRRRAAARRPRGECQLVV